jgi:D-inositol-3-phosphate glycosyltransferase
MTRLRVVHLVDDTTAGGVMRVLDHITTSVNMARIARHSVRVMDRRSLAVGRIDADVIVSHLSISWRGLPMLLSLRAANARASLVHVEHSYTEAFVAHNVSRRGRFATLLRTSYALFDRVVAVSHAQGRWLSSRGYVHPDALVVIQSCADMAAFRNIDRPKGPVRVIGAIGRLDRQKGFDTLIAAFRNCAEQNIALHIYGKGCEEAELMRLAYGDPRIRFMGFAGNPVAAMSEVDAVVMPSRWEAYGLVAIEALSAGRTLLVSAVDGLIDHEPLGAHVVHASSVRSWSNAIDKLVSGDLPPARPNQGLENDTLEARFEHMWQKLLGALNPSLMIKNTPIPAEELRSSVGASERLSHLLQ